jgi:ribokinase
MFDFLTIGKSSRDIFLSVPDGKILTGLKGAPRGEKYLGFEYGAKIPTDAAYFTFGGGAYNSATCLSKMGLSVTAGFRIGWEATGMAMLDRLKRAGIDCCYVEQDDELHTGMAFILSVPQADHVIFHYAGAGAWLQMRRLDEVETKGIYVTSLAEESGDLLDAIAAKAADPDIDLYFNPGKHQIRTGYESIKHVIAQSKALVLNFSEARDLVKTGSDGSPEEEMPELLRTITGWGAEIAVITDGEAGSYAHDGKKTYFQESYPAEVVDTTGAGDSFGAAFAAGMRHYGDIKKSLKLAAVNAASVVGFVGAAEGALTFEEAEFRTSLK